MKVRLSKAGKLSKNFLSRIPNLRTLYIVNRHVSDGGGLGLFLTAFTVMEGQSRRLDTVEQGGRGVNPGYAYQGGHRQGKPGLVRDLKTKEESGKSGIRGCVLTFALGESGKPFRENHPRYTQPGSNLDLPVFGSLDYCESSALDYATTKAGGFQDLNKNKFTEIEGLSFHGLEGLNILKLKHNSIVTLLDGAFWGLKNMTVLHLDFNNITTVTKGWLYGLTSLHQLSLSYNNISIIEQDGWEFCQQLVDLDLSYNKLEAIQRGTLQHLYKLRKLHLDSNKISYIAEGAFNNTPSLEVLELNHNRISWTIEDVNGAFISLKHLVKFGLASNHIKSINKNAFAGLEKIKMLDLRNNSVTSIQENAFEWMHNMEELLMNTTGLLCDCNLEWFPIWLKKSAFLNTVNTVCAYPEWLHHKSIVDIPSENFTCDDFPKPQIIEAPKTQVALKGDNITLQCRATSSSHLPMAFQWKKDNLDLKLGYSKQFARSPNGKTTEQNSELVLVNITDNEAGKYQCVVSNSYGTTYSSKFKISVLVYPMFTKVPVNVSEVAGSNARLECAATGQPPPQIAWQKDAGTDFPAARERRMHIMRSDDILFIVNIKAADTGVYSCTAKNQAGVIVANASLTVLEKPLFVKPMENKEVTAGEPIVLECMTSGSPKPKLTWTKDGGPLFTTERHFFTAEDQLLIIVATDPSDAGTYECEMSNKLGTRKGFSRLYVIPASSSAINESDITGIIIITIVCCAVLTSFVWVFIIYQTRKRMVMTKRVNEICQYPKALLSPETDFKDSAPHLYMDTNSEHSSSKDSGTGDSAKRSSDDLLYDRIAVVYWSASRTKMVLEQKCFICDKNILDIATVELKEKGIETLRWLSLKRNDGNIDSLRKKTSMRVHDSCHKRRQQAKFVLECSLLLPVFVLSGKHWKMGPHSDKA
uniref:Ig-like domain-containing protein n=1 Tax=Timema genevievae TaxID=629358 RepID=A0A7R9PM84_TIMGE|nr:unnamed protein product [Timema genevievae]